MQIDGCWSNIFIWILVYIGGGGVEACVCVGVCVCVRVCERMRRHVAENK